jgi:hypothetical protein
MKLQLSGSQESNVSLVEADYLLTCNCRHLDNAELKPKVRKLLQLHGYHHMPEICTPQGLLGGNRNEK